MLPKFVLKKKGRKEGKGRKENEWKHG